MRKLFVTLFDGDMTDLGLFLAGEFVVALILIAIGMGA